VSALFYPLTDVWSLVYSAPDPPPGTLLASKAISAGDATVIATAESIPSSGTYGLRLRNGSETVRLYLGEYLSNEPAMSIAVDLPVAPLSLALVYTNATKLVTGYYSQDQTVWTALEHTVTMSAAPTFGDLFFEQFNTAASASVSFSSFRVLPGTTSLPYPSTSEYFLPIGTAPAAQPPALTSTQEAVIHALVGAQFGDLEFDIGKSVRWTQWFADDVFITDVNYGDPRFWIVDWTKSFPYVNYKTNTGRSYFDDPVGFRKRQFADAEQFAYDNADALVFDNNDWVLWVDAHEGLSVDNTPPLPPDYDFDLFRSFVAREIRTAIEAGKSIITLPFFAFVRHADLQNVEYDWRPNQPAGGPKAVAACAVPYYIPAQGLVRLVKVSALRSPSFDWSTIDQPSAATAGVRIQVVSYGYAHWNLQDIVPPATGVPTLTADNDLGWKQRNLLSKVRPITGLPFGTTWQFPNADNQGKAGPWAPDTFSNQVTGVVIPAARPAIDPACTGVRVPLYDNVLRFNTRDGVWYSDGSGNVPMEWNDVTKAWQPVGNVPVEWDDGLQAWKPVTA
jgi:hypothetical protein